jgi:hypothetical protein
MICNKHSCSFTFQSAPNISQHSAAHSKNVSIKSSHCIYLVAAGAHLHVLLERWGIRDGLAGVIMLNFLGKITGVVLSTHGPAELGSVVPVDLLASDAGGKGWLGGRGKGRSGSKEGSEGDKLVL